MPHRNSLARPKCNKKMSRMRQFYWFCPSSSLSTRHQLLLDMDVLGHGRFFRLLVRQIGSPGEKVERMVDWRRFFPSSGTLIPILPSNVEQGQSDGAYIAASMSQHG